VGVGVATGAGAGVGVATTFGVGIGVGVGFGVAVGLGAAVSEEAPERSASERRQTPVVMGFFIGEIGLMSSVVERLLYRFNQTDNPWAVTSQRIFRESSFFLFSFFWLLMSCIGSVAWLR